MNEPPMEPPTTPRNTNLPLSDSVNVTPSQAANCLKSMVAPPGFSSPLSSPPGTTRPLSPPAAVRPPLPKSTPVKVGISSTTLYTTNQKYCIRTRTAMGEEMKRYCVGPMPPGQFLDNFFPESGIRGLKNVPLFKSGCYNKVESAKKEKRAYAPFVSQFH